MKCKQVKELMGAYIYGDLAPEEMRQIRLHAQDCPECREDIRARGAVISALDGSAPTLSDEDRQRIAWSVKGVVRSEQERPSFRWWPVSAFGLAVVVLVGLVAAKMIISHDVASESTSVSASHHKAIVHVREDKGPAPDSESKSTMVASEPPAEKPHKRSHSVDIGRISGYVGGAVGPVAESGLRRGVATRHASGHKRGVISVDQPTPIVGMETPMAAKPQSEPGTKTANGETKLPKPTDLNDAQTTATPAGYGGAANHQETSGE